MINITTIFNKIMNKLKKGSVWQNILLFLVVLFIIFVLINSNQTIQEGFVQKEKFLLKKGPEIFDDFYVDVYDELTYSQIRNNYEIGTIMNKTTPDKTSVILDIGSGKGHHVNTLSNKGFKVVGIDTSPTMIEYAKDQYPNDIFRNLNAMDGMSFSEYSFTHVLCMYFTIYYIEDKYQFFKNCYKWLVPGGELVIHLVDRDNFDAIMPNQNPFADKPKRLNNKRLVNNSITFENLDYKSHFDDSKLKSSNIGKLTETFKDNKTGHIRKNEHTFYMEPQEKILSIAKNIGFILLSQESMNNCDDIYDNQFIYVLQKPT